jgi:hypothetical protein
MRTITAKEMKLGDRVRICSEETPFNTMTIVKIDRTYVYGLRPFIRRYDENDDLCSTGGTVWFVPYTGYEEVVLYVDSTRDYVVFD